MLWALATEVGRDGPAAPVGHRARLWPRKQVLLEVKLWVSVQDMGPVSPQEEPIPLSLG